MLLNLSGPPFFFVNICEIILTMISRFSPLRIVATIIIRLHQPLTTLRSYRGLAGGVQSDGSYVLFSIWKRIVFAAFYWLWHQIKKVPVMCEMSSRVF